MAHTDVENTHIHTQLVYGWQVELKLVEGCTTHGISSSVLMMEVAVSMCATVRYMASSARYVLLSGGFGFALVDVRSMSVPITLAQVPQNNVRSAAAAVDEGREAM